MTFSIPIVCVRCGHYRSVTDSVRDNRGRIRPAYQKQCARSRCNARRQFALSVALRPALHLRDHMYRKIAANQTSRIKNLII
jgi:hypothetical protein